VSVIPAARLIAAEALAGTHLLLIQHYVRELADRSPEHVDRDDLASVRLLALVSLTKAQGPNHDAAFARFAVAPVRGAHLDELRAGAPATRSARSSARRLNTGWEELTSALGRTPTMTELAQYRCVSTAEMDAAAQAMRRTC
jgi:RNA polymerase sigma factor for flagellar operon FliA